MTTVRIDLKTARHAEIAMVRYLREDPDAVPLARLRQEIRAVERRSEVARGRKMLAHPKPQRSERREAKSATRAEKRDETAAIWAACWKRCGGRCECGCGIVVMRDVLGIQRATLDHAFGRGKGRLPQSVETCWILADRCHTEKTNGRPDAATWWRKFLTHLTRHQPLGPVAGDAYWHAWNGAVARLRFVETRSTLGAGLRERGT